jgi:hypothetical protein
VTSVGRGARFEVMRELLAEATEHAEALVEVLLDLQELLEGEAVELGPRRDRDPESARRNE